MRPLPEILSEVTEHGKAQEIRLLDVLVLGPLMLWFGFQARGMPDWARIAMLVSGAGTILFNWRNYLVLEGR